MIHEMKTHIWTSSMPIERVAKNEGFQREFRDLHANKRRSLRVQKSAFKQKVQVTIIKDPKMAHTSETIVIYI